MARSFTEWKTYALALLTQMLREAEERDDEKLRGDIEKLIRKLKYMKRRGLSSWISAVIQAYRKHGRKEFLKLSPTPEEVEVWIKPPNKN